MLCLSKGQWCILFLKEIVESQYYPKGCRNTNSWCPPHFKRSDGLSYLLYCSKSKIDNCLWEERLVKQTDSSTGSIFFPPHSTYALRLLVIRHNDKPLLHKCESVCVYGTIQNSLGQLLGDRLAVLARTLHGSFNNISCPIVLTRGVINSGMG